MIYCLELVLSLKDEFSLSIPLLRSLAVLCAIREKYPLQAVNVKPGILERKINRHYHRLCRVQEDLGRLDFRKAAAGVSVNDFVFSQLDFSRYREMNVKDFERIFPEGLTDFDEVFFKDNFGLGRKELQSLIERNYKKDGEYYRILQENPLIISAMRTLDTSLENSSLFSAGEINEELEKLKSIAGNILVSNESKENLPDIDHLYPVLVSGLDGLTLTHNDGMKTKLFISPQGDLSATFMPGNKAWTRVLIYKIELRT